MWIRTCAGADRWHVVKRIERNGNIKLYCPEWIDHDEPIETEAMEPALHETCPRCIHSVDMETSQRRRLREAEFDTSDETWDEGPTLDLSRTVTG